MCSMSALIVIVVCFVVAYMAQSNMEDMPDFLSMDPHLSLNDYLANGGCTNDLDSMISDEPWKELSDGSDSGIDSKYLKFRIISAVIFTAFSNLPCS